MSGRARRPCSKLGSAEPALFGFVVILQGDPQPLHGTERPERDQEYQRYPKHRVHPVGRMIKRLDDQRRSDHDEAGKEHNEDRWPVTGIGEAKIKPTCVAVRPWCEEALE